MTGEYYDRDGTPMTMLEWATKFEQDGYKIVEKTDVEGTGSTVSTVWLGIDHSFGDEPPLIFETLVFDGRMDGTMERYSTEGEARAGHAAMVRRVRHEHEEFDSAVPILAYALVSIAEKFLIPHAQQFGMAAEDVLVELYREAVKDRE